ncbi:hypothetical protein OBBRIDRAFT_795086 [Obba rivulosa]|uniref:Uncharacterized protein n=1 Tax=Obba rivulosa TaxID=1052685 RepID=A0A8E2DHV0_9APHY|nr:hypothetical protein OBBRIDRAFT_795086 [Obba rivulosa]
MTLSIDNHRHFDALDIWLEPTEDVDIYLMRSRYNFLLEYLPKKITFEPNTRVDKKTGEMCLFPNPDRKLLALHASCAQVFHLSGAAEYVEKVLRDIEETKVLASNGGSAYLLHNALLSRISSLVISH